MKISNKDEILNLSDGDFNISLQMINALDLLKLLEWKNSQRNYFFHKEIISHEQQKEWFLAYQTREEDFMFSVLVQGVAIGCMGIRFIKDEWDIYNVILGSSNHGKKGIMSKAFQAMLQFAISRHKNPISLKVLKYNPAVSWYEKNGFEITSEQKEYFCMTYIQQNY